MNLIELLSALRYTDFRNEGRMLNVIITQDIRFKLEGNTIVIPMDSELWIDPATNSTQIEDYFITIFPDEYMVVQ